MDKYFWLSICTLFVSLLAIIATNLFAYWSKRLDITQKINDHKLVIRVIYLTNKLKAAESAISRWTVAISYYTAIEQLYRGIDPKNPLLDEFFAPMEILLAKYSEAVTALASEGTAFLLYFQVDQETFWGDKISDQLFIVFAKISALVRDLKQNEVFFASAPDISIEDKKAILLIRSEVLDELAKDIMSCSKTIGKAKMNLISLAENVRQQLQDYEQVS